MARKYTNVQPNKAIDPVSEVLTLAQDWAKHTKFKHVTFGGVDEADVWKKIAELTELYEAALAAERIQCAKAVKQASQKAGGCDAG